MRRTKGDGRRRAGRAHAETGEGRDRWLVSYADLVTLLLALFVVLYAAADHERARQVARSLAAQLGEPANGEEGRGGDGILPGASSLAAEEAALEAARERDAGLRARTRVARTERGLVVSLTEAGYFDPGDATLRADSLATLDALAEALITSQAPVRVEGHTDPTPISNSRFPSNWELSTARASSVLTRLAARGVAASRLSAAGYAGERPAADNTTPEGRALNRRVDIVILPKP